MPDLRAYLERTFAARGGVMPFEEFMALALYDPVHGYYTKGIADVGGARGDFATSATLSDALARAIAKWLVGEIAVHAWRGPVAVIEVGGGSGALAAGVLKALGWWRRRSIRYHLVEVSPVLRELQRKRLGRSVIWHETIAEALDAVGGKALIVSNELVDAFPVQWLVFHEGAWREIMVRYESGKLSETFRDYDAPPPDLTDPREGQRIELRPSFRSWLEETTAAMHEGLMLTIDYGAATVDEVYHRRPGGTLRAYHRHERIEGGGIYARFGKQDLTSDVVFADLVRWGRELGWENVRLATQRDFLERHGAHDDAMSTSEAGEAFLVLEQRREFGACHTGD